MTYRVHQPVTKRHLRAWIMIGVLITSLLVTAFGYITAYAASGAPADSTLRGSVYINEIKSGGSNSDPKLVQYVTLYNASDNDVALAKWTVEYAKQAFAPTSCALANWKLNDAGNVSAAPLDGMLAAHTVSPPFPLPINDNTAGSVHVVDENGAIRDTVGWGDAAAPSTLAPCFETAQAAPLTATKSLQRYLGCVSNLPIDTDDNASDFILSTTPRPGLTGTVLAPQCPSALVPPPPVVATPVPVPGSGVTVTTPDPLPATGQSELTCEGIIISELLPNPAGTDTKHEFIELHNPTNETIALDGCSLQTSASTTKNFALHGLSLDPGEYRAFYDDVTGLSLPNTAGGTVWLVSPTAELQAVTYAADMDDDTVWALTGDMWAGSFTPTPGTANIATPLKPCDAGEVRNPDTNRCVSEASATAASSDTVTASSGSSSTAAACKEGQERNPATNRCRNIATAAAANAVTTCKAGQERNPDTNRCRNIVTTASTAKACPSGQERNADTNRCRKTTAAGSSNGSTLDGVKDVASSSHGNSKPYWLIAAVALIAAIAYGIYEWRQEIIFFIRKYLDKSAIVQPSTT